MWCLTVKRKLNALLDAELTAAERTPIKEHLRECASCREALDRLRGVEAALAQTPAPPPVPGGFAERLMARTARRAEQASHRPVVVRLWPSFSPAMRVAAAAMLALGIGLGALMGWNLSRTPSKPSRLAASADPNVVYGVDYLSEAPSGSLADAYLTLASAGNDGGQ
jgi:anti-sigma factor RsiW